MGIDRDSLRHLSQVYMNFNINTATWGKINEPLIIPRWELIPCIWLKIWANFPPAPQVEFSLSNRYVRGTLCFLSQVACTPRDPDSKEGRLPCSGLNSGSCCISKDEGMTESPVETLEKAVVLRLIWIGGITSLYTSRGTWNSRLQKETMPYSSWKWIGIPISLFQLESEASSPASPPEASVLFCQA